MSTKLDEGIALLAKDAARRPEKVEEYLDFLITLGRASDEGTLEQRAAIRAWAIEHEPLPAEATAYVKSFMGWE